MAKHAAIPLRPQPAPFPKEASRQDECATRLVKRLARMAAQMEYKRLNEGKGE